MKWNEIIKFSAQNLRRRQTKTLLTMVGVMVGTASIIVMISLGIGVNHAYIEQMRKLSTLTLIRVTGQLPSGTGKRIDDEYGYGRNILTDAKIGQLSEIEHVTLVSPVYNFTILAQYGNYEAYLPIRAISFPMMEKLDIPILSGILSNDEEQVYLAAGSHTIFNFYDSNDPAGGWKVLDDGSTVQTKPDFDLIDVQLFVIYDMESYFSYQSGTNVQPPKKYTLETTAIIGNGSEDSTALSQFDNECYMNLSAVQTLFSRIWGKKTWPGQQTDNKGNPIVPFAYSNAYVIVDDIDNVKQTQEKLNEMGFTTSSDLEFLTALQQQSKNLQYLLGTIGGISLLIAGLGITNTMSMSILERRSEIGIFKILGCSLPNIRYIFLTEAGIIGLTGGTVGIVFSLIVSITINYFMGNISIITLPLVCFGTVFSLLIGIVSGISPANKAMKLSSLEAIRNT